MMSDGPGNDSASTKALQRVLVLRAHRHAGDVNVAVTHRDQAEVFLARRFSAAANFAIAPRGVDLLICPPVLE